jgi:AcrR family transcriptional regulator
MVKMTDKTKQKILDAALKVFAKEGYKSTTTRSIAEKSGFTEMTLFRKFDTKEKLFDAAMIQNYSRFQEDFLSLVEELDEYESNNKFLEIYVRRLEKYFSDNFEFLSLMVNEEKNKIDMDMGELNILIGKYLEKNIKNNKIDHTSLGFLINSYLYVVILERYHGRKTITDYDPVQKFVENLCTCLN